LRKREIVEMILSHSPSIEEQKHTIHLLQIDKYMRAGAASGGAGHGLMALAAAAQGAGAAGGGGAYDPAGGSPYLHAHGGPVDTGLVHFRFKADVNATEQKSHRTGNTGHHASSFFLDRLSFSRSLLGAAAAALFLLARPALHYVAEADFRSSRISTEIADVLLTNQIRLVEKDFEGMNAYVSGCLVFPALPFCC
jgi:hypothetical protein